MPKYEGLIAAPFTAMHPDGSLDLERIGDQAQRLLTDGVRGAFVCGTTGEGLSLSSQERRAVAAGWREATPPEFAVIVHVGHASVAEARALAEHAADVGADAVAVMPSSPFASATIEDVARYAADIAEAVPQLPFFYYHIPSVSGIRLSVHDFLMHAGPRIPNLAGVKFTHEDLMDYARSLRVGGGRFDVLFGRDELFLAGLACGARAAVGSTYNFAAPLFHALSEAFEAGDLERARRLQHGLQEVVALLPDLPSQKHAASLNGIELGPARPPLRRLSPEEGRRLSSALAGVDFDGVCSGRLADVEA